jgi:hypothetical protein
VRSFLFISDPYVRDFVEYALDVEGYLCPDFLLQVSPSYQLNSNVDHLIQKPRAYSALPKGRRFAYTSTRTKRRNESYVVTSGTGSGKSLTYFLPIVDSLLRQLRTGSRTAALIVYPITHWSNSQFQALQTLKTHYEHRTDRAFPVTFAKYTSETQDDLHQTMCQSPPQILLTNYVMAESRFPASSGSPPGLTRQPILARHPLHDRFSLQRSCRLLLKNLSPLRLLDNLTCSRRPAVLPVPLVLDPPDRQPNLAPPCVIRNHLRTHMPQHRYPRPRRFMVPHLVARRQVDSEILRGSLVWTGILYWNISRSGFFRSKL